MISYDLAPLLAQADAETWLEAIRVWDRERRRNEKALVRIMMAWLGVASVALAIACIPGMLEAVLEPFEGRLRDSPFVT